MSSNSLLPTLQNRRSCAFICIFLCLTLDLNAQSIGTWNFNGNLTGTPGTFNTVSAADFSVMVPGRSFNAGIEYYGHNGWPAGGLDPALYLSFTLTPNTGYALNILSLDLRMRHSNTGSSGGSGPTQFTVRSSLDNYITDIGSGAITGAYANFVLNPGPAFNNLPTPITFRIYGHNAMVYTGGNNRFVFDNIRVDAIGVVLPVTLISFNAKQNAGMVELNYQVHDLAAGTRVAIERSTDNIIYDVVREVTEGTFQPTKTVKFIDEPPTHELVYYYRLKFASPDGGYHYSRVSSVQMKETKANLTVTANRKILRVRQVFAGASNLFCYNNSGGLILMKRLNVADVAQDLELILPDVPAGIYYLLLSGNGKSKSIAFNIY